MEKGTAPSMRGFEARARRMRRVSVRERQVVQARRGARVDAKTALPQVAAPGSQLADELLLIEMRLLSAMKHRAAQANEKPPAAAAPRQKEKIVARLKKKR